MLVVPRVSQLGPRASSSGCLDTRIHSPRRLLPPAGRAGQHGAAPASVGPQPPVPRGLVQGPPPDRDLGPSMPLGPGAQGLGWGVRRGRHGTCYGGAGGTPRGPPPGLRSLPLLAAPRGLFSLPGPSRTRAPPPPQRRPEERVVPCRLPSSLPPGPREAHRQVFMVPGATLLHPEMKFLVLQGPEGNHGARRNLKGRDQVLSTGGGCWTPGRALSAGWSAAPRGTSAPGLSEPAAVAPHGTPRHPETPHSRWPWGG